MANALPLPIPPRTPSPISDDGAQNGPGPVIEEDAFVGLSPNRLTHQSSSTSLNDAALSPYDVQDSSVSSKNPFGFKPITYTAGGASPSTKASAVGQRRGHKYKHSSVSHQIFLEPAPKAPLRLPASLPIPTTREGWKSMSKEQTIRAAWCICHLAIAGIVQWSAQDSLAVTALSHLIFYDAIGACLSSGIEVLSNFEVWKRSSVRQPFGLERGEVLVGFAMSILLLFMGFDLISHNAAHMLEEVGDHAPHRAHNHDHIGHGSVELVSLLAIVSTLMSALLLRNYARIAKAMRFASIAFLPALLRNPSHLLTVSCSVLLLFMPLLDEPLYTWMDILLSTAMALFMCIIGFQLVKTLGAMLLMSYSGPGVPEVLRDIETDPTVRSVEEAKFWQVHYGLCMANIKLKVRASAETDLTRLRERVNNLIKNRLGGGDGSDGQHWEVSTQTVLEND